MLPLPHAASLLSSRWQMRPLILKMLDVVTMNTSPSMEQAGLNMLRLVAVIRARKFRSTGLATAELSLRAAGWGSC